jgi:hypothetical protein
MKKNKKPSGKVIKDLAQHFEADFNKSLPISIHPNGSILYKDYMIKKNQFENWGIYLRSNNDLVEQFYLKTSALMAAKAYDRVQIELFKQIKEIDTRYWANYSESAVFRNNMNKSKDYERFLILLNKLEHSTSKAVALKEEISNMFKRAFV